MWWLVRPNYSLSSITIGYSSDDEQQQQDYNPEHAHSDNEDQYAHTNDEPSTTAKRSTIANHSSRKVGSSSRHADADADADADAGADADVDRQHFGFTRRDGDDEQVGGHEHAYGEPISAYGGNISVYEPEQHADADVEDPLANLDNMNTQVSADNTPIAERRVMLFLFASSLELSLEGLQCS